MSSYLISMVLMWSISLFHPLHLSVTDVEYDELNKTLKFTSRLFVDDIEKEIRTTLNEPYLDITNPTGNRSTNEIIAPYIKEKYKVFVNGKEEVINYLGHELEDEAIYCYFEIDKVEMINDLTIENSILLDYYDDQVNMVHLKVDGKLRSTKITPEKRQGMFEF
jgi:hypothetical protein